MKNVVFVAHLDKAMHTGALNLLMEGATDWSEVSGLLDTSIMLDPQQFHCTFCHSLNGRKFYKLEDILGARDLIVRSFAGADALVLIIGGNDVADALGGQRSLHRLCYNFAVIATLIGQQGDCLWWSRHPGWVREHSGHQTLIFAQDSLETTRTGSLFTGRKLGCSIQC